jgi:hypothetical protein
MTMYESRAEEIRALLGAHIEAVGDGQKYMHDPQYYADATRLANLLILVDELMGEENVLNSQRDRILEKVIYRSSGPRGVDERLATKVSMLKAFKEKA